MSEIPSSNRGNRDEFAPDVGSPDAGDSDSERALRDVFHSIEPGLRAFLRQRLRQESDVDDCLQVVFVKLAESGHNVGPAARRAWLFRVAANESARMWRSEAATTRALEKHGGQLPVEPPNPAESMMASESAEHLREHVRQLPEAWQQVVRMRIEQNLTFREIAEQLGIPIGTALTQMRRALERLRDELNDSPK